MPRFLVNGVLNEAAWTEFKNSQAGLWFQLPSGRQRRVLFLRSHNPDATQVIYNLSGINYDIERTLNENPTYLRGLLSQSHVVLIETGGLSELNETFRLGRSRETLDLDEESEDVYHTILATQDYLREVQRISVGEKVNLVGLSAGGWFLEHFAAQAKYAPLIRQIILQSPGGLSVDDYFITGMSSVKDMALSMHVLQKPFANVFNFALARAQYWAIRLCLPLASLIPNVKTFHEAMDDQYRNGATQSMGQAFAGFQQDPLLLQFAIARLMGLRTARGHVLLMNINPQIPIHFVLGRNDNVVPPGLYADLIEAARGRDFSIASDRKNFSVHYFTELGHDLQAEADARIAALTNLLVQDGGGMTQDATMQSLASVVVREGQVYGSFIYNGPTESPYLARTATVTTRLRLQNHRYIQENMVRQPAVAADSGH
jgi:pimeloyl-ACP methyl ester carboxylesterase